MNLIPFGTKYSFPRSPTRKEYVDACSPITPEPVLPRHQVCFESLRPWNYLLSIPGKNIRDSLIQAFSNWIYCNENTLILVEQIIGYLHSGSLLIDDIEDDSDTRRGVTSAHIKYGVASTLNAGNYVYFLALEKVLQLPSSTSSVSSFTEEMLNLHKGQGRDIYWRDNCVLPSEDDYLQMIKDKTGGLFRLCIKLMKNNQQTPEEMSEVTFKQLISLADDLACFFQVRDDLINLASPKFHEKKGFCDDITEGKLSFIVLHSFRQTNNVDELKTILGSRTRDRSVIKKALSILQATDSFQYTIRYLENLQERIMSEIQNLGNNPALEKIVNILSEDLEDCKDINKVIHC